MVHPARTFITVTGILRNEKQLARPQIIPHLVHTYACRATFHIIQTVKRTDDMLKIPPMPHPFHASKDWKQQNTL